MWERREMRSISFGPETVAVVRAAVCLTSSVIFPLDTLPDPRILEALIPDGTILLCESGARCYLDELWWVLWQATQLPQG